VEPGATVLPVGVQGGIGPYLLLFLVVVASGAGVPAIGTVALTAAAVLASQDELSIDVVIVVGCLGAAIGGVIGYGGGRRWGLALMERPGRWEEERKRTLERGHDLYGRWGWLACFVIPSFVAGIARMRFAIYLIFGTIAAFLHASATALGAYGAGKVASGHHDIVSVLELVLGLVVLAWLIQRVRLRRRAAHAPPPGAGGAQPEHVTGIG
jgi:membrane protein DedA with SNARE-associated domain